VRVRAGDGGERAEREVRQQRRGRDEHVV
jgi:hypothetical protein